MHEQGWEGTIELLQAGRDPMQAFARLWRRDDASGTLWGGQLELPGDPEHRPHWGRCAIRLPDGREGVAVISRGPLDAGRIHPALIGEGAPPFGDPPTAPQGSERFEATGSRGASRPDAPAEPAPAAQAATASQPAPAPLRPAPSPTEATPPVTQDRFERTEALAKAFLGATEARRVFHQIDALKLEGAVVTGVQELVDELASFIESRLHSEQPVSEPMPERVRLALSVLQWFAGVVDGVDALDDLAPEITRLSESLDEVRAASPAPAPSPAAVA